MDRNDNDSKSLHDAICKAFDIPSLRRLCTFKMRIDLDHDIGQGSGAEIIFNLLRYLQQRGQLGKFIQAVREERPDNKQLHDVLDELELGSLAPIQTMPGGAEPPALSVLECPYPGMTAFDEKNADRFYGREEEVQVILRVLELRRCLFLIGRSGSGKSSLVLAGLRPALEKAGWAGRVMRPGPDPAAALAGLNWEGSARRLLIVDQFEEVFTQANAEGAL